MSQFVRVSAACAALVAGPAAQALAADYDPPIYVEEAPEYVPVEIGSGWYLRGDVAYSTARRFRDVAMRLDNSLFNNALVNFDPALPLDTFAASAKSNPISGSIGIGYHVNDILRLEANIGPLARDRYSATDYLGNAFSFLDPTTSFGCLGTRRTTTTTQTTVTALDGTQTTTTDVGVVAADAREGCNVGAALRNSAWTGTVNAYADLGTVMGFTPYVGVGGGLLYTSTKLDMQAQCNPRNVGTTSTTGQGTDTVTTTTVNDSFMCRTANGAVNSPTTYTPVSLRQADYHLLYSLSAGVAYQLTPNAKLDLGYQYLSAPDLKGFDLHQVKVGLRYDLW